MKKTTAIALMLATVNATTLLDSKIPLAQLLKREHISLVDIVSGKELVQKHLLHDRPPMLRHASREVKRIFHDYDSNKLSDMGAVIKWSEDADPDNIMICETTNRRCRSKTQQCDTPWTLHASTSSLSRHDFFGWNTALELVPLVQLECVPDEDDITAAVNRQNACALVTSETGCGADSDCYWSTQHAPVPEPVPEPASEPAPVVPAPVVPAPVVPAPVVPVPVVPAPVVPVPVVAVSAPVYHYHDHHFSTGFRRLVGSTCRGVERGYKCNGHTNPNLLCADPNYFGGWEDGSISNYRAKNDAPGVNNVYVSGIYQNSVDITGGSMKTSGSVIRPYYKCCIPLRRES